MKKAIMRITAFALAAGMAVTGSSTVVLADNVIAGLGSASLTVEKSTVEEIQGTEVSADTGTASDTDTDSSADASASESGTYDSADSSAQEDGTSASEDSSASEGSYDSADVSADTDGADASSESSEAEEALDTSMSGELAFAQCEEYINVRSSADTDSEVVGKVYNNGSVTILGKQGDWYQIQSGNATGYVKAEYFATGEEAEEIADEVGYDVATVYPEALVIRSDASEASEQIGMAYEADQLEVVEYEGDWMKVALGDDTYGYVNAYYVSYDTYYSTAETLEEEQERLDEQWLAYLAEQEAEAAAESASYSDSTTYDESAYSDGTTYDESTYSDSTTYEESAYSDGTTYDESTYSDGTTYDESTYSDGTTYDENTYSDGTTYDESTYSDSTTYDESTYSDGTTYDESTYSDSTTYDESTYSDGTTYDESTYSDSTYDTVSADMSSAQASADAAYQTYLDAQAVADAATQGTDEQAVYDTAAAAQAAYQEFLDEQAVVDALAAGLPVTEETQSTETYQETYTEETQSTETYQETYTEETQAAETYQETYTEETQAETYQEETAAQTEATYSSTGQAIADYAVQFVGNPYVWGGTSLTNGADCSGFTQSVFANFGISIPRTAAEQAYSGTSVDLSSIQAGDLLFYSDGSGISHVALYIGGGQVVHASTSSTGIIISSYNYRTPVCAVRYY